MTTTTNRRRGEGANYQFLPQQIREGRSISPKEKKILGYIISKCVLSSVYDNEGCIAISYDQIKKGAKVRSAGTIQYSIRSLVMGGYLTYKPGTNLNEANRYTLSPMLTDMINEKTKMVNFIPADDKKDIDMAQPEQQPAPVENNIDYKQKYDSLYARSKKWINDLGGGKYIEAAVAFYRNHKDSNGQPDEEKNALQAEIEQLKAENERLRKSIDSSLQKDTPQEQHDGELQKYKNSLELAVNENKQLKAENAELKVKLEDKHLNDEKNRRIAELTNEAEEKDKEISKLKAENAQQERTHERQVEELTQVIRDKDAAIKNLKSDLKKAKTEVPSLVVEPSTPYGGNVKLIQYN